METFICWVCETEQPVAFRHKHHVKPRSVGGTKKDEIYICDSCHMKTHAIARAMLSKDRHHEVEGMLLFFKDDEVRRRIATLAQADMQARVERANDSVREKIDDIPVAVRVDIPPRVHSQLSLAAKDRRVSMGKYILAAIQEKLEREL